MLIFDSHQILGEKGPRGDVGAAGRDGIPGRTGPKVGTFCYFFLNNLFIFEIF